MSAHGTLPLRRATSRRPRPRLPRALQVAHRPDGADHDRGRILVGRAIRSTRSRSCTRSSARRSSPPERTRSTSTSSASTTRRCAGPAFVRCPPAASRRAPRLSSPSAIAIVGTLYLGLLVNWLTAFLGAFTLDELHLRLHAAQADVDRLHHHRRRSGRDSAAHGMDRRDRPPRPRRLDRFRRSCSSGSSRTSWRSAGCTARTTAAPDSR